MHNIYGAFYLAQIKLISIPNKYTGWYCDIITKACNRYIIDKSVKLVQNRRYAVKQLGYVEGHHIFPRSLKSDWAKDIENVVYLTAKEHYVVHLLLTKMFVGRDRIKMIFAFRRMHTGHKSNRYTSRLVNLLRPNIPAANKGKIYINNGVQTKYISKSDSIPQGWHKGPGPAYKHRRQQINECSHQTTYSINYLDGTNEIVPNMKIWSKTNNIPYPTMVSAARSKSLVRKSFYVTRIVT